MDRFRCSRRLIDITYRKCLWQCFNIHPTKDKFQITYTYRLTFPRETTENRLISTHPVIIFMPFTTTHYTEELSHILYMDSYEDVQKYIDKFKREKQCWDCGNMEKSCKEK